MNFTPKSEKELSNLLNKGDYPFELVKAEEKTSKSGNQMMQVLLKVFDGSKSSFITDYLLIDGFKLRHFCYSTGIGDQYEKGILSDQMLNERKLSGICSVGIEVDKTGQYPDRNKIFDYKESSGNINKEPSKDLNDDVPF